MRPGDAALAALAVLVTATAARAEPPSSQLAPSRAAAPADGIGQDSILLRSRAGVEVAAAHFRLAGGSGEYLSTSVLADLTVRERLSVRVTVPLDVLAVDGAGTRSGVGDVEARMKLRLFESERWLVQASIGAQFPTGSTTAGLGNGAPVLVPLLTAGYELRRVILFLTVSDDLALRAHGAPPVDLVDPSTDHELVAVAGANARFGRGVFAQLTVTPIIPLLAADRGQELLYVCPQLGWTNPVVRLTAGVQLPVAGVRRFDERAVFGALFFL